MIINLICYKDFWIIKKMKTLLACVILILVYGSFGQESYDIGPSSQRIAAELIEIKDWIVLPFPWPNKRCCNTHNIIALDCSGSMYGLSWSKAGSYLSSVWGSSDYTSFFTHGGTWGSAGSFLVTNYYTHQISPVYPSLPPPYGDTDYDDPLIRAMGILSLGYPDKTCITFISDGW